MLLERSGELQRLGRLLDDAGRSGGRVVLIRGRAGIGKTAFVSQFVGDVGDRAHVLVGGCDDLLTPQPLGPVWDLAEQEAPLLEALRAGDRRAVMGALLALMSRRLRPSVVVVEDVQWADEATLDLVKYLGRRAGRIHGLLILTYRDGEVDAFHPLRGVIGEISPEHLVRTTLEPLSLSGVAALIRDTELDPGEVMALTGGNPLFVTEVAAWGTEQVPPSVQDSVLARAAKVSPGARRLLDLVSVIPGDADLGMVRRLTGSSSNVGAACVRQGLLEIVDGTVSFRHELARRAVESVLGDEERRRLHRLVLDEMVTDGDPAVIVHHARAAGADDAIIEYAPVAARAAQAVGAHRGALQHFLALEPHLDRISLADRAAIWEGRGRSEYYLGEHAGNAIDRAIELYREAGLEVPLARVLTFAIRPLIDRGRLDAAEEYATEAVAILETHTPSGDLAYAVSQLGVLRMLQGRMGEAAELNDRAIATADDVGDELARIDASITRGATLLVHQSLEGFQELERCRRQAEQAGLPYQETRAVVNMAQNASDLLGTAEGIDLAKRAREVARRHELLGVEAAATVWIGRSLMESGDWARAKESILDLVPPESGLSPKVEARALAVLAKIEARTGGPRASDLVDRCRAKAEESHQPQSILDAARAVAEHLWLTGTTDREGIEWVRAALDTSVWMRWLIQAGALAFWLWELGELASIPDGIAGPYRLVMEGNAAEAAAIWETKGFPYEQALALMHGDDDRLQALQIFEDLGATVAAGRVRQRLRDTGVTIPRRRARSTRDHPLGLTTRQAEVLELLAEGITNAEIADRLFISQRTVDSHVAAVLTKLDATSRHQVVTTAQQRGLLPGP